MASSKIWMIIDDDRIIYLYLYIYILYGYVFWEMMRRWRHPPRFGEDFFWHPPKDLFFGWSFGKFDEILGILDVDDFFRGLNMVDLFRAKPHHICCLLGFPTFCIGCSPNSRIPVCHSACSTTTLGSLGLLQLITFILLGVLRLISSGFTKTFQPMVFTHDPVIKQWMISLIPSGKQPNNYGKSPSLMAKSTIFMAIFNSYFDITRG